MRLGQLLENYVFVRKADRSIMLWYQEDDETEEILKARLEKLKRGAI